MEFLNKIYKYFTKDNQSIIVCGDFNICHFPIDIHDPIRNKNSSGFLPEEREWMSQFLKIGFIDIFRKNNLIHIITHGGVIGRKQNKEIKVGELIIL